MNTNPLYLILPPLAAVFWGLLYAINGRVYQYVTLPTNMLFVSLGYAGSAFVLAFITKTSVDFTPYFNHPQKLWFWSIPFIVVIAGALLHFSIKNISATYAALGEVAYVALIPLFAWLLFGQKQWNSSILIGAVFILIGLYFVISGQAQKSALPGA